MLCDSLQLVKLQLVDYKLGKYIGEVCSHIAIGELNHIFLNCYEYTYKLHVWDGNESTSCIKCNFIKHFFFH